MLTVLPSELQALDDLAEAVGKPPRGSAEHDAKIDAIFHGARAGEVPCYTSDLNAALTLIPDGWWWHISHLEVSISPTSPARDMPICNGVDYEFSGRPLAYRAPVWHDRKALPAAVCAAMLLARCGLLAKAASVRDNRMYLIQTGDGPRLVDGGVLKDFPAGTWLRQDGVLVARADVFAGRSYLYQDTRRDKADETPDDA